MNNGPKDEPSKTSRLSRSQRLLIVFWLSVSAVFAYSILTSWRSEEQPKDHPPYDSQPTTAAQETDRPPLDVVELKALIAKVEAQDKINDEKRIAELVAAARTVPVADTAWNINIYAELVELDPKSQRFRDKLAFYQAKRAEQLDRARHPYDHVHVKDFSWSLVGFSNVMEASLTLHNDLEIWVKDVLLFCQGYAPSGTLVSTAEKIIYQKIPPKGEVRVENQNFGFFSSDARRAVCKVTTVVPLT